MFLNSLTVVLVSLATSSVIEDSEYVIETPDIIRIEVNAMPKGVLPFNGEDLVVKPDGKITLGTYGSVSVSGKTIEQAGIAIGKHLAGKLITLQNKLEVNVELVVCNSKVCYVVLPNNVTRMPCNAGDTVTDLVKHVNGAAALAAKGSIWIARGKSPDNLRILPVDWEAITRDGVMATNYQILPDDRLFVVGEGGK